MSAPPHSRRSLTDVVRGAVFMGALLGLVAPDAVAADDVLTLRCGSVDDPTDPAVMVVGWSDAVDASGNPRLTVRTPDVTGLTVQVDYRLVFDGESVTWSDSAADLAPLAELEFTVDPPTTARFDTRQDDWVSDLLVMVSLQDADGVVKLRQSVAGLTVGWDDDGALLMDADTASLLAPGRAWSAATQDEVATVSTGDEDFVTTYSGGE